MSPMSDETWGEADDMRRAGHDATLTAADALADDDTRQKMDDWIAASEQLAAALKEFGFGDSIVAGWLLTGVVNVIFPPAEQP